MESGLSRDTQLDARMRGKRILFIGVNDDSKDFILDMIVRLGFEPQFLFVVRSPVLPLARSQQGEDGESHEGNAEQDPVTQTPFSWAVLQNSNAACA
ncbi:hypothetical protein BaRGS_00008970 [Batillaria attramentaria]|uniref:Uncharacterized protein n=1 Tax=Batillaria attramentaria TaxID=370345 RepID=A0ABD0LK30_9CAEN